MQLQARSYATAAARVLMALIFVLSGLSKIGAADAIRGYMEAMHVPGILLWPTIIFEVGAGVLVIVGYQTRVVAALLAGFCVLTGVIFHNQFSDQFQMIMFLKNLSMAGGFALLASVGSGALSLDAREQSAPSGGLTSTPRFARKRQCALHGTKNEVLPGMCLSSGRCRTLSQATVKFVFDWSRRASAPATSRKGLAGWARPCLIPG